MSWQGGGPARDPVTSAAGHPHREPGAPVLGLGGSGAFVNHRKTTGEFCYLDR